MPRRELQAVLFATPGLRAKQVSCGVEAGRLQPTLEGLDTLEAA